MARFVKKLLPSMLSPVLIVSMICGIFASTEHWGYPGLNVTLTCTFTRDVQYPTWEGPLGTLPNETRVIYNDDGSAVFYSSIGEKAARLSFAENERDLVIDDLKMSDDGYYYCWGTSRAPDYALLHVVDSDKPCPTNCLDNQCHINGTCSSCREAVGFTCCIDGYFGPMCEDRCAENCLSCIDETQCISCANGYFNPVCSQECIGHCVGNKCGKDDPRCEDGCEKGYYPTPYCQYTCGKNCVDMECDYEGGYCTKGCEGRHTGISCEATCNSRCGDCDRFHPYYCINCQPGYYGNYMAYCSMICPGNCLYDNCTFDEGRCEDCKVGFWGETCSYNCSSNCLNDICEQNTGTCTYGCKDKNYSSDNCACPINCYNCSQDWVCDQCKTGYEVDTKDCTCSSNFCTDNQCTSCISKSYYKYTNSCCECSTHCKDNECFSGAECSAGCKDGFYLLDCSGSCSDIDANCQSCFLKDIDRIACNQCKYGYYPNNNGVCVTCPINCYNGSCSSVGHCDDGCVAGYWSDNCEIACYDKCSVCQQQGGKCVVCKSNTAYGYDCDIQCSKECVDNECDTVDGHCTSGCVMNHYGKTCEYRCAQTCLTNSNGSRCAVDDGGRLMGCVSGYFGLDCTSKCSQICNDAICHRESGKCSVGCIEGYEDNNGQCAKVVYVSEEDSKVTLTIIAASAGAGGIVIIVALIVCVVCCFKRRNRAKSSEEEFQPKQEPRQSGIIKKCPSTNNTSPVITVEEHQYASPYDVVLDENYEQLSNSYVEARYAGLARNKSGTNQLDHETKEQIQLGRLSGITANANNTVSLDIRERLGHDNSYKPTSDYEN